MQTVSIGPNLDEFKDGAARMGDVGPLPSAAGQADPAAVAAESDEMSQRVGRFVVVWLTRRFR